LPEGRIGEIEVGGRSLTAGYQAGAGVDTLTRFADGTLRTGDLGFLHHGQLFVLGRLGDGIKLRGRTLLAEDVEAALEAAGLPRRRQTVLLGHTDHPVAVLIVEKADPEQLRRATPVVARLTEGVELIVIPAPIGTIVRTTSGKPQRRALWQSFRTGELRGEHS
jgi:acyl-CoA synthetase (AMP-forming)/AMP-acid ligase II